MNAALIWAVVRSRADLRDALERERLCVQELLHRAGNILQLTEAAERLAAQHEEEDRQLAIAMAALTRIREIAAAKHDPATAFRLNRE